MRMKEKTLDAILTNIRANQEKLTKILDDEKVELLSSDEQDEYLHQKQLIQSSITRLEQAYSSVETLKETYF